MAWPVAYIGNLVAAPQALYEHPDFELKGIICEETKCAQELEVFSQDKQLALFKIKRADELMEIAQQLEVQFILMHSFGRILKSDFLNAHTVYNIHEAYLPYYKGRNPTFWATMRGEKEIGISLHKVTPEVDGGEIVTRKKIPYPSEMNEVDLRSILHDCIPELLRDWTDYLKGERQGIENNNEHYFRPVRESDYTIDLERDTYEDITNKVRSQAAYRGAKLILDDGAICWVKAVQKVGESDDVDSSEGVRLVELGTGDWIRITEYEMECDA